MTGPATVPARISLSRDQLAALLAHHADVLAANLQTDATTGLPERVAGLGRAVELLGLHAEHLTAEKECPPVAELLDSMLSFRAPSGPVVLPAATDQTAEITRLRIELGKTLEKAAADRCADYAAGLRDAAAIAEQQRQLEPAYGARKSAQVSENVGILRVAEELRRRAEEVQPAGDDTLPAWLHWRFGPHGQPWSDVPDEDKALWEHQARAVRRAVARGGFMQAAAGARRDEPEHVCNSVVARGHMDEPLGYQICGICGTRKNGEQQ
ncbi:hypothetical protein ACFWMV_04665 [Streptomyces mutabilis]|uniref:hypothetical protein n=1 Tax=Streptomyces mutabilis TaxID=67332 RepID=UPI00364A6CA4